jgi:hypothetical protein
VLGAIALGVVAGALTLGCHAIAKVCIHTNCNSEALVSEARADERDSTARSRNTKLTTA